MVNPWVTDKIWAWSLKSGINFLASGGGVGGVNIDRNLRTFLHAVLHEPNTSEQQEKVSGR